MIGLVLPVCCKPVSSRVGPFFFFLYLNCLLFAPFYTFKYQPHFSFYANYNKKNNIDISKHFICA